MVLRSPFQIKGMSPKATADRRYNKDFQNIDLSQALRVTEGCRRCWDGKENGEENKG